MDKAGVPVLEEWARKNGILDDWFLEAAKRAYVCGSWVNVGDAAFLFRFSLIVSLEWDEFTGESWQAFEKRAKKDLAAKLKTQRERRAAFWSRPRPYEQVVRWTVLWHRGGKSFETIAKTAGMRFDGDAVKHAVLRFAADIGLTLPKRRK